MINGKTLLEHELMYGLTHPPWRDLDDWAEEINKNDGRCLAKPDRFCPCQEAVEEIQNAPDGEHACCSCMLFCDDRYIEYLKTTNQTKKQKIEIDIESMKNQKTKDIVIMFTKVIEDIENEEPWEAPKKIQVELDKEIKRQEAGGGCELCKTVLEESIARTVMTDKTCDTDTAACKIDRARTIRRLEELRELYYEVGKELVDNPPSMDDIQPKDRKFRDEFHQCQSQVMKNPMVKSAVPNQHKRMSVASMYCAGKVKNINDAITLAGED